MAYSRLAELSHHNKTYQIIPVYSVLHTAEQAKKHGSQRVWEERLQRF